MVWEGKGVRMGWDFGKIPHIPYIPKCGHLSWEQHLDGRYATINNFEFQIIHHDKHKQGSLVIGPDGRTLV